MNPTDEREQEEDGKNMGVVSRKRKTQNIVFSRRLFGAISSYTGISRDTAARERLSAAIAREFIHQTVCSPPMASGSALLTVKWMKITAYYARFIDKTFSHSLRVVTHSLFIENLTPSHLHKHFSSFGGDYRAKFRATIN